MLPQFLDPAVQSQLSAKSLKVSNSEHCTPFCSCYNRCLPLFCGHCFHAAFSLCCCSLTSLIQLARRTCECPCSHCSFLLPKNPWAPKLRPSDYTNGYPSPLLLTSFLKDFSSWFIPTPSMLLLLCFLVTPISMLIQPPGLRAPELPSRQWFLFSPYLASTLMVTCSALSNRTVCDDGNVLYLCSSIWK